MQFKKIFCAFLSTAFMFVTVGSYASSDYINHTNGVSLTLKGIINTNDDVNVSHIKVDIMSSELKQDDDDVLIYENTYQFSVYTDYYGVYSFSKPSPHCLVQIDLSSIPKYTGVDKKSYFVDETNDIPNFTLCEISSVKIAGIDNILVYDSLGNELITDIDIEVDNQVEKSYKNKELSDLSTVCTVNANGYVKTEQLKTVNNYCDLITKADKLYELNTISKEKWIEMYIEALKSKDYGDRDCSTFVYDELYNYLPLCDNKKIASDILSYIGVSDAIRSQAPEEADYSNEGTRIVSNSVISYTLHYEKDISCTGYISEDLMDDIQYSVQGIINHYFLAFGFNTPMLRPGDASYQIYLSHLR